MRVCVVGAGAIGCYLGARLGAAGCEVSALARGPTLAALRQHGMRLACRETGQELAIPVQASACPHELGPQDVVVVAVKGTALHTVARDVVPLLGRGTIVIPAMNGVPWWFFTAFGGMHRGLQLTCLDPDGLIRDCIPFVAIVASVVYPNCERRAPGYAQHNFGKRIVLGAPAEACAGRAEEMVSLFTRAGFDAALSCDLYSDIWNKAVGNSVMNPVAALTGATCDCILEDPSLSAVCHAMMQEAIDIGSTIGCEHLLSADEQIGFARSMGRFTPSMLQDVQAGNVLEIEPLTGVMSEIGHAVGVDTRRIDALLGLARVFAKTKG
jgi:2-dehydropantoate 2-reductase